MVVEASKMPGNGKLVLTGQLGSVMKESATIALNWIRSHARQVCTSCYKFIFFILCVVEMQIIIHTFFVKRCVHFLGGVKAIGEDYMLR